ncbi:MAG: hypothetical protein AB8B48_06430 [Pseudomonadales bacterium]
MIRFHCAISLPLQLPAILMLLILSACLTTADDSAADDSAAVRAAVNGERLSNNQYGVHYVFEPLVDDGMVKVSIEFRNADLIKSISFRHDKQRHLDFVADGKLKHYKSSVRWEPEGSLAKISFKSVLDRQRNDGGYDAYMTSDWAIFRGDKIVPTARVRSIKGSESYSTLEIKLPAQWTSADTGWQKIEDFVFRIDNPERRFDRPTGWMIAGKLGTRRDFLQGTEVAIAAPQGGDMQRMNALALINLVWPEVQRAFQALPPKVLVVGAGDPMWRGGLSSPNSFYVHSDRPLISENGTSTLLHELTHVITRIQGGSQSDWIAEGLAEYYSIELMHRAGAMNQARYDRVLRSLSRWGENVSTLRKKSSSGATTARAVILLHELDKELKQESKGQYSIDNVTRDLMKKRKITNKSFRQIVEDLLGKKSEVLDSHLLR